MTGSDTIAAVSTAPGEGGIGIVRVSGERAAEILGRIFVPPAVRTMERSGGMVFADKTMYYGHIVEPASAEVVDEALVCFMKGPRSYTGEDVCEIQCHGGSVPLRRILDIVCGLGAVPAQPGEFTKRAFLNGRLDLVQAGAVIDLIRSKTARGYHAAREQAEGRLSERVRAVRDILLGALAEIAVRIDYPEAFESEDGEDAGVADSRGSGADGAHGAGSIEQALTSAAEGIRVLLSGAETGRIVKDGLRAVILGKPNTGKSSLFNAMARDDAAIVTETAGTTRDALEIWLDIRGVPVLLVDTAGIRQGAGQVEAIGIERAKEQYQKADVSILLLDGSQALSEEDIEIARGLDPGKKLIVVINKADLPQVFGRQEAVGILPFDFDEDGVIQISLIDDEVWWQAESERYTQDESGAFPADIRLGAAGRGGARSGKAEGVAAIESALESFALCGAASGSSLLVTKARHKVLLEAAATELAEARSALAAGTAPEFVEIGIRAAWEGLGEMIGETASDDVIDRVFEEFCVGK